MKPLKIFLASSEELENERIHLADLVCNLNYILHKQNIDIELVKWEYLDAGMDAVHKQNEYNEQLKKCELCMVLYWNKFGKYTKSELDTAFNEHKSGNNPRKLYVYFKKDEAGRITEELKTFRDSFPTVYGHFFSEFNNIDSLKAHFLLQFMDYQNACLNSASFIEIKDSQVYVSNVPVANLKEVTFTRNNEEYNRLLKDIKRTRKLLSKTEVDDPDYSTYAQELIELENKQKEMEESLWNTALTITRLSNQAMSERLKRAIELFNSGDNRGANAILNEAEIENDINQNLRLIEIGEEGKNGLRINIDELKLKINTLKNAREEGWGGRVYMIHEKIVSLTEKLYGSESKDHADALFAVADELQFQAKYNEALGFYENALKLRILLFGENHHDVAECYNNIGSVYAYNGDYTRALELYDKSLRIKLDISGENHPGIATSYNNIGYILSKQGNLSQALEFHNKSLSIRLEFFGENHSDVAKSYNNISMVHFMKGEYEEALKNCEQALNIQLGIYGETHPSVVLIYNNIGAIKDGQGNYEQALENYEKAMRIQIEIFGENHPNIAMCQNNIASIYFNQNNFDKALECYKNALKIQLGKFDEYHPDVAMSYYNIGFVYSSQENYIEALEYYNKSLNIRLRKLRENHPDVALTYNTIADVYMNLKRYQEAEQYRDKALTIRMNNFIKNHPYYVGSPEMTESQNEPNKKYTILRCPELNILYSGDVAVSDRIRITIGLVNNDKIHEAGEFLNETEIEKDFEYNFSQKMIADGTLYNPKINIDELKLKLIILKKIKEEGWEERVCAIHKKIVLLTEKLFGSDSEEHADALFDAAEEDQHLANYDSSLDLYKKALNIRRSLLGKDHPDMAIIYNNISLIYMKQDKNEKRTHYREIAIKIGLNNFNKEHPDLAVGNNID